MRIKSKALLEARERACKITQREENQPKTAKAFGAR